jgi:hypothetical protein
MNCLIPSRLTIAVIMALAASSAVACTPPLFQDTAKPGLPEPLKPPAGHGFLFELRAEGVQIYECKAKKTDPAAFEWDLKAPEADLFDDRGDKAGSHGAGPSWTANDGSKVVAVKTASAPAPGGRAVPWLLLRVETHEGKGRFDKVTYIQRVDTWAGLPPTAGATKENAGKLVRVKYEATYRFYGAAPK